MCYPITPSLLTGYGTGDRTVCHPQVGAHRRAPDKIDGNGNNLRSHRLLSRRVPNTIDGNGNNLRSHNV
ncbi:hypothetical protein [Coleofasciculus sp. E2-BRE-01]|uniref:hypothetical protein n=1 Tax=Coleofasciculus sp. E2-BRE-01 TaxID=3069524 RepID=UPI0032FEBF18